MKNPCYQFNTIQFYLLELIPHIHSRIFDGNRNAHMYIICIYIWIYNMVFRYGKYCWIKIGGSNDAKETWGTWAIRNSLLPKFCICNICRRLLLLLERKYAVLFVSEMLLLPILFNVSIFSIRLHMHISICILADERMIYNPLSPSFCWNDVSDQ